VKELEDEPDLLAAQLASPSSLSFVMSTPSIQDLAVLGASEAGQQPSSVDLPLPEGPTIARNRPTESRDRADAGSSADGRRS
jgi:hypothetical protein